MHVITYLTGEPPYEYAARCRCGWRCKGKTTWQQAEDEAHGHLRYVERIRHTVRSSRTPSLKTQRDYYREMAENPEVDDRDRRLWAQLADELDHRLNDGIPAQRTQPELPFG